ncbi:phage portal protein, partial [Salipiger manganoxidans]|nr:phage portal protein [Salipiger manganoxidans]
EQLASDWSKTNYSSARAAMIEIWRGWTARRTAFAQGFCQLFFMAWLEEQVLDGHITLPRGAPDFYAYWPAYARAKWIGPGKGFVDPVKEAQAAAMRVALGLSTLEEEAAELTGTDYADNMEQIGREIAAMPKGMLHPAQ